ncbi:hypothetical protein [Terracoccus luteus]|uniref:ABC-type sugar transport system ATPase subunit n=1 Tax=Terracoccus luteus TaxID=53356 RepID=A0A495Y2P7_9MICO|nr:hypothetical protein [Terracoccus luteus]MBB2987314.1 ABC-type sugar transport system ATPase subunit [Terracoccus luteus]MCP2172965.1 ABC-type sugar transport system ATPase subunit [Terracoccus luteus]RKT79715.1 hypothetical protein DFJ68_3193 [Terracoccus luteus]
MGGDTEGTAGTQAQAADEQPVVRLRDCVVAGPAGTVGPFDLDVAAGTVHVLFGPVRADATAVLDAVSGRHPPLGGEVGLALPVVVLGQGGAHGAEGLAAALGDHPAVVVLADDPTRMLGPEARDALAAALRSAVGAGSAVLVATDQLRWAATASDVVTFVRDGRLWGTGDAATTLRRPDDGGDGLRAVASALVDTQPPGIHLAGLPDGDHTAG